MPVRPLQALGPGPTKFYSAGSAAVLNLSSLCSVSLRKPCQEREGTYLAEHEMALQGGKVQQGIKEGHPKQLLKFPLGEIFPSYFLCPLAEELYPALFFRSAWNILKFKKRRQKKRWGNIG